MARWLDAAISYIPKWLAYQMRQGDHVGLSLVIAHQGKPVLTEAFGHANHSLGEALTPEHRFRVASHSKVFTAAALMKLRERGLLRLDDPVGRHVPDLHPQVAAATLAQLLSHSAGLVRDGRDAGQWMERRPFLDEAGLRADLDDGPTIAGNTRFKYSNHGYGLLGLVIESVSGEAYTDWVGREIVAASGLHDTWPDAPAQGITRLASGHTSRWPVGHRLPVAAGMSTRALASATGFVSTAADLARFFESLSPKARRSVLSVASRREMLRPQWREPHATQPRWYGLGIMSGELGRWSWFGHTGGFPGTLSRTACVPEQGLSISALCNAADGPAQAWVDGILRILQAFELHGAPSRGAEPWSGRWWSLWGATDLVPVKGKVLLANPALADPLQDAGELGELRRLRDGTRSARIVQANGYAAHGEPAQLLSDARGRPRALQLAGARLLPEKAVARELLARYG